MSEVPPATGQPQNDNIHQKAEMNTDRFNEIVKRAREYRYMTGKIPRDTKMDVDGQLQRRSPTQRDYGWSVNGDPAQKENMMYESFVHNFGKEMYEDASSDSNKDMLATRFIFKVPIKDSTDVFLVDMQAIKFPPDDSRKNSFPATPNKTMVRISGSDADYLLNEYRKNPDVAEKFYRSCFPDLDLKSADSDKNSGIERLQQENLIIIEDITAPINGGTSVNSRFSIAKPIESYRRWYDVAKQDPRNYLTLTDQGKKVDLGVVEAELVIDKDERQTSDSAVSSEEENSNGYLQELSAKVVRKCIAFAGGIHRIKDQSLPARMANFISDQRRTNSNLDMLFFVDAKDDGNLFLSFSPSVTQETPKSTPLFVSVELPKITAEELIEASKGDPNLIKTFFNSTFKGFSPQTDTFPNIGTGVVFVGGDLKYDSNMAMKYH